MAYNKPEILSLDCTYLGLPFVFVCADPAQTQLEMDLSYLGLPFVTNSAKKHPIRVNKVSWLNVNKFLSVDSDKVSKIVGVSPI